MIKHPSDRAERRRLKKVREKGMGPKEDLVSPSFRRKEIYGTEVPGATT
jgi:hypothetical protein